MRELFTLTNGLRVIHEYRPNSNIIDTRLTLKSGAFYDSQGFKPGTAHFLEHIMHEKTSKYQSKKDIDSLISMNGGLSNAFTYNNEKMCFFATVTKDFTINAFEYLSEITVHPVLTDESVEKHRSIIKQELLQTTKLPSTKAYLAFRELVYKDTPLISFTIGDSESIDSITLVDLQSFYNKYFKPQNSILSISGDITLEDAKKLSEIYFSTFLDRMEVSEAGDKVNNYKEVIDKDLKIYKHVEHPEGQALIWYGGVMNGRKDPRYFSLLVLARILAGDNTSIFYKILRDDKHFIYHLNTLWNANEETGFFGFEMNISQEHIQKAIDIMKSEIQKIADGIIESEKIVVAKARMKAEDLFNYQRVQSKAQDNSDILLLFEDIQSTEEYMEKVQSITKEDIISCANFVLKKLNILVVVSKEMNTYSF